MSEINVSITANTVAWYAAIVSTLVLLFEIFKFFISRKTKVKIKINKNMTSNLPLPEYDGETNFLSLTAVNKSHHSIFLEQAGVQNKRFLKTINSGIFPSSIGRRELKPFSSTTYLHPINDLRNTKITHFYVLDETGKIHNTKNK